MIKELHEKLKSGQTTSQQLVEECFDRIEKRNDEIFAYLTLLKKEALEEAKKVDEKIKRGEQIGILEGIPGAIKDNILIQNVRATSSSKILDNYVAPYDATVIRKLKEAGAIFLGKTNCDEFAMGSSTENSGYGPTKNPVDTERVPGGSSGGSAAAVADDQAIWALGSDTGGSIRQPASFCGIVGMKPTYGRVSRYGLMSMASSLDQIGPMTKTVEDAAIILSIISGEDLRDSTSAKSGGKDYTNYLTGEVKGVKIGYIKEHLENLSPEMKENMEEVIAKYKKLGAKIKEIEMPNIKYSLPAYYIIMSSEVSSNLARFDGIKYGIRIDDQEKSDVFDSPAFSKSKNLLETYLDTRQYGLGAEVKRRIMLGTYALSAGYYDAYYLRAQKVRSLIRKDFEEAFNEVDLILTPTAPTPAFKIGEKTESPLEMYLADIFTITANIAGVPAISIPSDNKVEYEGKDLPVGFQLLGKWFDEETVLRTAHAYEIN
jgi:aspartyl-tRNA(Asn)/glutamyl-tRNA(Gln) amidotransferase subunit A